MLVCVDNGYDSTKVRTVNRLFQFESKFEKANDNVLDKDILEYQGEKWINKGQDDIENNKTKSLIHKLCTLKALGELTENKEEFDLIIDLPLTHYQNKEFREQFKEYISSPKRSYFKYKGKLKETIINKCIVVPQALASLYSENPQLYKGKVVGIIDVGGLTIDGCIVKDLKPIKSSIFTVNLGTTILENRMKTALNEKYFLNIQDYEMDGILKNGILGKEKLSKDFMLHIYDEHFSGLLREMRAKNWSLETLEIKGIGGGLIKFENMITKFLPNLQSSENPVFENVNGLFNIGRMM